MLQCTDTLVCPSDVTLESSGPSGAMLTFSTPQPASGRTDIIVSCTPAANSFLALGTHTVACHGYAAGSNADSLALEVLLQNRVDPNGALALAAIPTPSGFIMDQGLTAAFIGDGCAGTNACAVHV